MLKQHQRADKMLQLLIDTREVSQIRILVEFFQQCQEQFRNALNWATTVEERTILTLSSELDAKLQGNVHPEP